MTREDLIVLCDEAIDDLEARGHQDSVALNNLHEIRASLVNEGK